MSTLRTAAQQALEALEWHYRQGHSNTIGGFRLKIDEKALRELRAALAQQAEPVAGRAFLERILAAMEGVIDVADRKTDEFDALRSCVIDLTLMLHTAPPQRKPLTDEEIDKATAQERDALLDHIYEYSTTAEGVLERIRNLCRAVERAVWEKNHG